ncbi:riboflavin synthase [Spirulina sp. CS-785/01]|uniref:riboflavin synthase n=1 Tax=Spirulina sp. CS-785/01 TaxID=3021716 RepID=UPI00232D84B4|nr:riboflavin synthase [Spirulina sp. CS-785/01]MDB9314832.1 riboflavin synthase [Spirulina sp. CS-785/01]
MFTGIIQSIGKIQPQGNDRFQVSLVPSADPAILSDIALGDSIAVDGVCLTVETILARGFVATASPETLARTTLGRSSETGGSVNLEASLRVGSKIGGHFVTGHVDGVGCLQETVQTDRAWELVFSPVPTLKSEWDRHIARYLVSKGSITVNGISLTVAACDSHWFKVAVIPVTYKETNLHTLSVGDWVNLEGDILGKYVERFVGHSPKTENDPTEISLTFLAQHGYG